MIKEQKNLKSLMTGKGGLDSRSLEKIFKQFRQDKEKMRKLLKAFCTTYLIDGKQRPLLLRPLQEDIIIECLMLRDDDNKPN